MSTQTFKLWRPWLKPWLPGCLLITFATLLAGGNLQAQTTMATLSGGNPNVNPKYLGYENGNSLNQALYHTPCGLAIDGSGNNLFVADRDNNAIRYLDLKANLTWTFDIEPTNLLNQPVGVAVAADESFIYVLNRGNGTNGSVLTFDNFGDLIVTNAAPLTNACAMTLDTAGNIYVTVQSNTIIKITPTGVQSTVATIPLPGTALQGIVAKHNGLLAVCDSGRNGIYLVDPGSGIFATNAGFNGTGDFNTNGNNLTSIAKAKFNQPTGIAEAGDGSLIVTDYGNNRVKVISGTVVTNLYGVTSQFWGGSFPGWYDGKVVIPDSAIPDVQSRQPFGIVFSPDGSVYTSEDFYHLIRKTTGAGFGLPPPPVPGAPTGLTANATFGQVTLSWTTSTGATNYNVKRSPTIGGPYSTIGNTANNNFVDSTVVNGRTYYYVVSALNTGGEGPNSAPVQVTVPLPPVPDPQIGYVTFPYSIANNTSLSVFQGGDLYYEFNNDTYIVIKGTPNSSTYYTYGLTTNALLVPDPSPTNNSSSVPSDYADGLTIGQIGPYVVAQIAPNVTIKAMGTKGDGSPNSAVVTTSFAFKTGAPGIIGNNPALFTVSDITTNAHLYYTLDGTDPSPTNGVDLGTVPVTTNVWLISLQISTNTLFEARAFRDNYQPSPIVSTLLLTSNVVANTISFGFPSGEASSSFIGSPGQTFYAPVTLNILPGTAIYGLAFNINLVNVNGSPDLITGAYDFSSMLLKPIPATNPVLYTNIPAAMFVGDNQFTNLNIPNTNLNTIGVTWIERAGATNLYDTRSQTLITYSMAHDDLFPSGQHPNGVIVGGYGFQIPPTALPGQQYQIQIGRVSASSDGIGTPGSAVFISTPTNGSLTGGAINSIKLVTAGQSRYLVGDAYPFGWFNAGDFGSGELVTNGVSDVLQVFESAVYGLNTPPSNTDFYDCMDSVGNLGILDTVHGYYTNAGTLSVGQQAALYNNNDPTEINANMFGDGQLDVSDVYVTSIRSLFSTNINYNLLWVQRFWTNGVRAAQYTANPSLTVNKAFTRTSPSSIHPLSVTTFSATNQPKVSFTAGDAQSGPGAQVQIPIKATVYGDYPLRVLLLNLSVVPLDGSPDLTSAVSFTPVSSLGPPTPGFTDQRGAGNYSAAWLSNTVAGVTGTTTIGILNVTLPTNATASSAYAVHFDHASGSPSGFVSFPKQTTTGLILLSSRTNSAYNDGIPDSWRLRYFGTVYNYLSVSNADADGDGYNNWQEYVAGTDPTDPNSLLTVVASQVTKGQPGSIQWPSVAGKQYVIQRSTTLFPPVWTPAATVTGTGTTMEFDDTTSGKVYFYRVQVQ